MSASTNVVWLEGNPDESVPNELRSHIALFTNEDACYQFLCSLPATLRGLTLVVTNPNESTNRLVQLQQISAVYILSSSQSKPHIYNYAKIHGLFHDRQSLRNQILSDLNRSKLTKPGFIDGIVAPFQGLYFIVTHRSTWARAIVPALAFTLVLLSLIAMGIFGSHKLTDILFLKYSSAWKYFGKWILFIVLCIAVICLSVIIALLTAQPLSSLALESLVRAQERNLKYPNRPEEAFCASVWRSIRIAIVSLLIAFSIFATLTLVELVLPPAAVLTIPMKFIATGFILAYDIIDYPLSLHLYGVRERTPWFRHYVWTTLGFGLSLEVILLIPGAFLFVLPAAVCGATRLVVAAERASIDQPLLLNETT